MVAGRFTSAGFDARLITSPLGPASPFRTTVPRIVPPPTIDVGEIVRALTTASVTVIEQVFVVEPRVAVTVTGASAETVLVFAVKETELLFCGIVTVQGGISAAMFELDSETVVPPGPAYPFSVTPPATAWPPRIEVRDMLTLASPAGFTVTVVDLPPSGVEAVRVTSVLDTTPAVFKARYS